MGAIAKELLHAFGQFFGNINWDGIVKLSQGVQKVTLEVGGISPSRALFLSAVGGKAAVKPTTPHESGIRWES